MPVAIEAPVHRERQTRERIRRSEVAGVVVGVGQLAERLRALPLGETRHRIEANRLFDHRNRALEVLARHEHLAERRRGVRERLRILGHAPPGELEPFADQPFGFVRPQLIEAQLPEGHEAARHVGVLAAEPRLPHAQRGAQHRVSLRGAPELPEQGAERLVQLALDRGLGHEAVRLGGAALQQVDHAQRVRRPGVSVASREQVVHEVLNLPRAPRLRQGFVARGTQL